MAGASVGKAETGKDSSDASWGRQWIYPYGFHFPEYGLGPVGAAPVIQVESYHRDDFLDFSFAERCFVHRVLHGDEGA
jgi:hypothetical protein